VLEVVVKAAPEALGTGDHVVQASSYQAKDDDQDQSVPDMIRVLASPPGFDAGHESANEDANHDDDAVPVDGQADEWQSECYGIHVLTSPSDVMSKAIIAGHGVVCNQTGLGDLEYLRWGVKVNALGLLRGLSP